MDALGTHKDLLVWRKAIALAQKVYAATRILDSQERSDLNAHMRRTAVSIATRIAEGSGRGNRGEIVRLLSAARALLLELEIQTMLAIGEGYFEATSDLPDDIAAIGRLLNKLIRNVSGAPQIAHAKACAPAHSLRTQESPRKQSLPSTSPAS